MSDDLVAFLKARLGETAAKAEAAREGGEGRWHQDDAERHPGRIEDERGEPVVYDEGSPSEAQAAHIVDNDPARVLAEVEAKRQLVKLHGRAVLRAGGGAQYFDTETVCRSCEPNYQFRELSWPCTTLRLLALPHADHPDYLEKWRP